MLGGKFLGIELTLTSKVMPKDRQNVGRVGEILCPEAEKISINNPQPTEGCISVAELSTKVLSVSKISLDLLYFFCFSV